MIAINCANIMNSISFSVLECSKEFPIENCNLKSILQNQPFYNILIAVFRIMITIRQQSSTSCTATPARSVRRLMRMWYTVFDQFRTADRLSLGLGIVLTWRLAILTSSWNFRSDKCLYRKYFSKFVKQTRYNQFFRDNVVHEVSIVDLGPSVMGYTWQRR